MVVLSLRQVKYELCSSFACLFYELCFSFTCICYRRCTICLETNFLQHDTHISLQIEAERCDVVKITASLIFVQHRADKNNKFTDIKDKFVFGHKKIQKNL